jgi:hypothetical protein
VEFRLVARSCAESPDFLAEQAFWFHHYRRQVAVGHTYLEGRLADYERRHDLASQTEISAGDTIPVNIDTSGRDLSPGCLVIGASQGNNLFRGTLSVVGQRNLSKRQVERTVRWEEDGVEKVSNRVMAEILDITPISEMDY